MSINNYEYCVKEAYEEYSSKPSEPRKKVNKKVTVKSDSKKKSSEVAVVDIKKLQTEYLSIIENDDECQRKMGSLFVMGDVNDSIVENVSKNQKELLDLKSIDPNSFSSKFKGLMARTPLLSNFVSENYKYLSDDALRNGKINEITDGIFKAVETARVESMKKAQHMYDILENTKQNYIKLTDIISELENVQTEDMNVSERNFFVMARQQELMLRNRIMELGATVTAAYQSSERISAWIPILHNELRSSLLINNALNSIKSANDKFEQTIKINDQIAGESTRVMRETLLNVTKSVNTGEDLQKFEDRISSCLQLEKDLREINETRKQQQEEAINKMREINTDNILEMRKHVIGYLDHNGVDMTESK